MQTPNSEISRTTLERDIVACARRLEVKAVARKYDALPEAVALVVTTLSHVKEGLRKSDPRLAAGAQALIDAVLSGEEVVFTVLILEAQIALDTHDQASTCAAILSRTSLGLSARQERTLH